MCAKKKDGDTHTFHFKLDSIRKQKLFRIAEEQGLYLSDLIENIIKDFFSFIEAKHFRGYEQNSKYDLIQYSEEEIPRESVYVSLPYAIYRRLKLIHHDLNFYSIAQLVRWTIDQFLKLKWKQQDNLPEYLRKLDNLWERIKDDYSVRMIAIRSRRENFSRLIPERRKQSFVTVYDSRYSAESIFLV